jgi:hypothetical protein
MPTTEPMTRCGFTTTVESEGGTLAGPWCAPAESMWVRTRVYRPGSSEVIATMLLNSASLKDSFVDPGD